MAPPSETRPSSARMDNTSTPAPSRRRRAKGSRDAVTTSTGVRGPVDRASRLFATQSITKPEMEAATAQRQATVRKGLDWLAAKGHLSILEEQGDDLLIAPKGQPTPDVDRLTAQLRDLLEETQAYRAHFAEADKDRLL